MRPLTMSLSGRLVGSPASDTVDNRLSRNGGCHEEVEVHRVTDRCDLEGRGSWRRAERADEEAWDQPCDLLQLASEVRRCERLGAEADEGARGGERKAQTHVCGAGSGERSD